jgi:methionyl-tRNA formyltransferase
MLDADEYPKAFIRHGNFRIEFSRPALRTERIKADVTIRVEETKAKRDEI